MPFLLGAPRSGTTLLRFMCDAHPEVAIPPETGFFTLAQEFTSTGQTLRQDFFHALITYPGARHSAMHNWADFEIEAEAFWTTLQTLEPFMVAEGYRAFYRLYAGRFNKRRYGDKTPVHCFHMDTIRRLLPEARFIHIIRDGRDVALSLRPLWFSPGWDMKTQAEHWCQFVAAARQHGRSHDDYMEVFYEDLLRNPVGTLQNICTFLHLPYDAAMLRYYERTPRRLQEHKGRYLPDGRPWLSQMQRFSQQQRTTQPLDLSRAFLWKSVMSREERREFESVASSLLQACGYDV